MNCPVSDGSTFSPVFREIQNKTNTRIHFKDELETDTHKVLCIKGENHYLYFLLYSYHK